MGTIAKEDPVKADYFLNAGEIDISLAGLIELLKAVLEKGACFRFKARGWSMLPSIRDEDIITISPIMDALIDIGKAVAFFRPGTKKLIVHRIIGRTHSRYLLKGDSPFEPDGLIPRENILGVVTNVERSGKRAGAGSGFEEYVFIFLSKTRILFFLSGVWRLIPRSIRRFLRHE